MAHSTRGLPKDGVHAGDIMTLLSPGTPAPDFSARASDGATYRLSDLLRESRVLLVFYPGNNTPG